MRLPFCRSLTLNRRGRGRCCAKVLSNAGGRRHQHRSDERHEHDRLSCLYGVHCSHERLDHELALLDGDTVARKDHTISDFEQTIITVCSSLVVVSRVGSKRVR